MPASSSAVRTACRSVGGVVTLPRVAVVGDVLGAGVEGGQHELVLVGRAGRRATTPLRSNCQATAPGSAIEPPLLVNTVRISEPVRLRLSVSTSMSTATPPGA